MGSPDPTGTVTVMLDAANRVSGVSCPGLDQEFRTPGSLDRAVRAAFVKASLARLRHDEVARAAGSPRPRPMRVQAPPRVQLDNIMKSGRTPQLPDFAASRAQLRTTTTAGVGVSDNQCVKVTLDPGGTAGVVEADPGWLGNAPGVKVGAAIMQAFEQAYRERDGR